MGEEAKAKSQWCEAHWKRMRETGSPVACCVALVRAVIELVDPLPRGLVIPGPSPEKREGLARCYPLCCYVSAAKFEEALRSAQDASGMIRRKKP